MMPLGTKVGLGPGHIVLHGDPAPPTGGTPYLIFGSFLLWPNCRPSQLLLSTVLGILLLRNSVVNIVEENSSLNALVAIKWL